MPSPDSASPLRVALVDDTDDFRELFATLLPRIFHVEVVKTFDRADAALEWFSQHPVDCVLTDYKMPGMNGLAFIEQTRRLDPPPKVYLCSFSPSEETCAAALRAGAAAILNKATVQEELKAHFPPRGGCGQ